MIMVCDIYAIINFVGRKFIIFKIDKYFRAFIAVVHNSIKISHNLQVLNNF